MSQGKVVKCPKCQEPNFKQNAMRFKHEGLSGFLGDIEMISYVLICTSCTFTHHIATHPRSEMEKYFSQAKDERKTQ